LIFQVLLDLFIGPMSVLSWWSWKGYGDFNGNWRRHVFQI